MIKIATPPVMAAMDRGTIQKGTPGLELMERAGDACARIIHESLPYGARVCVICGGGNNGGDGFVIARRLADMGHGVAVFSTGHREKMTPESRANYDALGDMGITCVYLDDAHRPAFQKELSQCAAVADCLFGNGLKDRPLTPPYVQLIQWINDADALRFAIDIPSGLRADIGLPVGAAVRADCTIAIQAVKAGCMLADGPDYCGLIKAVDIGIDTKESPDWGTLDRSDLSWPRKRNKNSHKYQYGVVAAVAGSQGMYGAGVLACQGALKAGAGLVTSYIAQEGYPIYAEKMPPEIMVRSYGSNFPDNPFLEARKSAVLFGPGIGRSRDYSAFLAYLLQSRIPAVIDADGLWHLAKQKELLEKHNGPLILTPHFGEFSALTGKPVQELMQDPVGCGLAFAAKYQTVLVLKSHHTLIISPEGRVRFNTTGNAGMAVGGSGDVLAGMIAAILAAGEDPYDAALAGVYYHGAAGDAYAGRFGETTLTPTDLINSLSTVLS